MILHKEFEKTLRQTERDLRNKVNNNLGSNMYIIIGLKSRQLSEGNRKELLGLEMMAGFIRPGASVCPSYPSLSLSLAEVIKKENGDLGIFMAR